MKAETLTRILLIDDHSLFREAIARLLGREGAVERGGAGPVHRARQGAAGRVRAAAEARPARALGTRFLRRAGRAGPARAPGRLLHQRARGGAVPGPCQSRIHRRVARDGERAPVRFLGLADRGAPDRIAAERGQARRRPLRHPLQRPPAPRAIPVRHDGLEPGHRSRARKQVPVVAVPILRRCRGRKSSSSRWWHSW